MSQRRYDLPNGYGMVSSIEEDDPFLGIKVEIETEGRDTAIFRPARLCL